MASSNAGISTRDLAASRKRTQLSAPGRASKRSKTAHATSAGVFSCFTFDGNDVNLHRRSTFSAQRKDEVRKIRKKGACLRCRLLKRPCSGEDPCKTCVAAARAAAKSKSLMWMECVRPSFQAINIFDKGSSILDQARINSIMDDLLDDDVYLDFHIPFALNVEAASSHLARWLSEDESPSAFSVVGIFSSSTNTNLIQNALDPSLGRDLRLFVHLTTYLYTTGMQCGYQEYTDEEIQSVRDCVGNRLLLALDPLVRPSEIEASEDKLAKLRSLFLLLLGTIVGMRYTCSELFEETGTRNTELESKQEALIRLLCHYLLYIGKATALLEKGSDEKDLLQKWKTQWDKPASFTWNPTEGLEMHYRIEPPADWIVSSSEDESLSGIDIDLSEFDDVTQFTQDSDLLKCIICESFWTNLDADGLCENCRSFSSSQEWISHEPSSSVNAYFPCDVEFFSNPFDELGPITAYGYSTIHAQSIPIAPENCNTGSMAWPLFSPTLSRQSGFPATEVSLDSSEEPINQDSICITEDCNEMIRSFESDLGDCSTEPRMSHIVDRGPHRATRGKQSLDSKVRVSAMRFRSSGSCMKCRKLKMRCDHSGCTCDRCLSKLGSFSPLSTFSFPLEIPNLEPVLQDLPVESRDPLDTESQSTAADGASPLGTIVDPFKTMPQASSPHVSVEELKSYCSHAFGQSALKTSYRHASTGTLGTWTCSSCSLMFVSGKPYCPDCNNTGIITEKQRLLI